MWELRYAVDATWQKIAKHISMYVKVKLEVSASSALLRKMLSTKKVFSHGSIVVLTQLVNARTCQSTTPRIKLSSLSIVRSLKKGTLSTTKNTQGKGKMKGINKKCQQFYPLAQNAFSLTTQLRTNLEN